jgi:hypothetical protein
MRITLIGLFLAMTISAGSAQDIGGRYRVEGKNINGSNYSGTAEITITSDTTCRIIWDTGSISSGICMRNGVAFAAGYVLGESVGLVIYELMPDGSMQGVWTVADTPGEGYENLYPLP